MVVLWSLVTLGFVFTDWFAVTCLICFFDVGGWCASAIDCCGFCLLSSGYLCCLWCVCYGLDLNCWFACWLFVMVGVVL